ncbi:MAG TPA: IS110 family transposase [Acidimicrobiales bacterium]|nr:IS110 family transposase [Acidimicrobiales bacterium]
MGQEYVGIDLHKRRSVIVQVGEAGQRGYTKRVENSPTALVDAIAGAELPEVVLEATCGWYWAYDSLVDAGARVHLANPSGLNWGQRRVKNDERDAQDLADMLRLGRLPEAWPAPQKARELRELVRYRAKLVCVRSGMRSQVQGVLTKCGIVISRSKLCGAKSDATVEALGLSGPYKLRVTSLRALITAMGAEISALDDEIAMWLAGDVGYRAILAIKGIGPVLGAVFVAEIGDVGRFASPDRLCSWAGLTPKHRESDLSVHRGRITKQGSRLVRWAAVEAVSRARDTSVAGLYARVAARRGANVARVAAARKLLSLVYYGLRDGEVRCLAKVS